jgi:hypothetical protein
LCGMPLRSVVKITHKDFDNVIGKAFRQANAGIAACERASLVQ